MNIYLHNSNYDFSFTNISNLQVMPLSTVFELDGTSEFADTFGEYLRCELHKQLQWLEESGCILYWWIKPNGKIEIVTHTELIDYIK